MTTLPFAPLECDVYVDKGTIHTADEDCCSRYNVFRNGFDPSQTHPAVLIPRSLAEAVERAVKAKRALDAMLDAEPFVLNDDLMLEMDAAINAMVTLWPEAQT